MTVTITSIELKSKWNFFRLSWNGLKITLQTKKSPGFIKMKNTGKGVLHYTITAWESEKAVKDFARTGAHAQAMKITAEIANAVTTYTYQTDNFPDWNEAKELLKNGKTYQV